MNWFFIALIATFCFSTISHIDKYLISKYLRDGGIGGLMLFSSLFAIFLLPVIFIIEKDVFSISATSALFLIMVGILSFVAVFFYFKALTYTDASVIIPFFQLIPVFGFALGFILLKETIPLQSIVAGLIIMIGVIIISIDKKDKKSVGFQKKIVFLMIGSSFTYAFYEVLFKLVTIPENFWISFFWQNVGLFISGILLYFFVHSYRKDFHDLIRNNGKKIFTLNIVNEILNTAGVSLIQYASLLVPITLVLLVNSLQPAIVFVSGILLTLFLPKIARENITSATLIQKGIAIVVIFAGTYLLYH